VAKTKVVKKRENAIVRYFRETRAELRKVRWPSRAEAWSLTQIVLAVTVSMAIFLGLLDWLFSKQLAGLIDGNGIAVGISVALVVGGVVAAVILNRREA
jgi:preprotein translocase subunit SecE